MEETSESPGAKLTGSLTLRSDSYRFASVRLSNPVSSSSAGTFLTEPFLPFAGAGLIAVTVTGPTTYGSPVTKRPTGVGRANVQVIPSLETLVLRGSCRGARGGRFFV